MTVYFKPEEFRCRCGRPECDAPMAPSDTLLERLEMLRARVGRPIVITSGLRCRWWNEHEHGEPNSGHLTGEEVDVATANSHERWQLLAANWFSGPPLFERLGIGATFLHLGTSLTLPTGVCWAYYAKKEG